MIRVVERTRRKAGGPQCVGCRTPIKPGDLYREVIAIRHDAFDKPFVRMVAHNWCLSPESASGEWAVTYKPLTARGLARIERRIAELEAKIAHG